MTRFQIFETDIFSLKLNRTTSNDTLRLKAKLHGQVYTQLKQQPKYGKNIKKLVDVDNDVWRYNLGNFRIFYTMNEETNTIYILTLDIKD